MNARRRRCRLQREEDRGYVCKREVALQFSINYAGEKLFASNARREEIIDEGERSGEEGGIFLFVCLKCAPIICESVLIELYDIYFFGFFFIIIN